VEWREFTKGVVTMAKKDRRAKRAATGSLTGITAPTFQGSPETRTKYDAACVLGFSDKEGAKSMYRQAAEEGDTRAMDALGHFAFMDGDTAAAIRWYGRMIDAGDLQGAYAIGQQYQKVGDLDKAEHWYGLAARSDNIATRYFATDGLGRVEAERARAAASAPTAGGRTSGIPDAGMPNVPPATVRETPVPTLASPEQVLLDGIAAGQELGGYSFSYAMGQLNVYVWQSTPEIGGWYQVGSLPIGEWFVVIDQRGFPLPVAIQRVREHAFYARVDPAPLQGLRALAATPE
jgi:TPR repeat protein